MRDAPIITLSSDSKIHRVNVKRLLALADRLSLRALVALLAATNQVSYGALLTLRASDLMRELSIGRSTAWKVIRELREAGLLLDGEINLDIAWRGCLKDWEAAKELRERATDQSGDIAGVGRSR